LPTKNITAGVTAPRTISQQNILTTSNTYLN